MIREVLLALWFFVPAGVANAVPVLAAKIPGLRHLEAPMDFGKTYRGMRVFGAHKTWRGFIVGIVMATLALWLQQLLAMHFQWARTISVPIDYTQLPVLVLGPLFAIGALGGDAIESFFKRQRHVPPGHGWFPFDQIDYIIGGALITAPFIRLTVWQYGWLILLWLIAHVIVSYIAYLLKLKERPI